MVSGQIDAPKWTVEATADYEAVSNFHALVGERFTLIISETTKFVILGSEMTEEKYQPICRHATQGAKRPSFFSSCCACLRIRSLTTRSRANFLSTRPARISSSSMI